MHSKTFSRSALLAVGILSACAAVGAPSLAQARMKPLPAASGVYGAFLSARFAVARSDYDFAADQFLEALDADPGEPDLVQQAFTACLLAGRPDAVRLARQLPANPAAELLLADIDARAGNWASAEARFTALPHQGLTQLLQPLLVAWAQQGGGHVDSALATLRPLVEGQRFRSVYALHAAIINDIADRPAEASRLYRLAQTESGELNLRLAQILASWQTREGHGAEADQTLRALIEGGDELSIALPALTTTAAARPVSTAAQGIAEAYLALAAALRQQDSADFAQLLLRFAIDLRPDFTAARLLMSDVLDAAKHLDAALAVLDPVTDADPLASLVRLRRASIEERMGHTDTALKALERLAHDYPDRPEPLAMQGDILRSKDRFGDAVAAYDRAVRLVDHPGRSDWPLFYDRAIALERAHQWPLAEQGFLRALELEPDQPYVMNYLGYSWTEQGQNLSRARKLIERAVELRPNDGSIVDSLGWVLLRDGDPTGAVKQLEHAVELQPEDSTINAHLGDAYWAAGRKQEARFQWRRALTLHPEPDDVPKLEAKLRTDGPAASTGVGQGGGQGAGQGAGQSTVQ